MTIFTVVDVLFFLFVFGAVVVILTVVIQQVIKYYMVSKTTYYTLIIQQLLHNENVLKDMPFPFPSDEVLQAMLRDFISEAKKAGEP